MQDAFSRTATNVTNLEELCAWLWSTTFWNRKIARVLFADDKLGLEKFMPIIHGLTQYLDSNRISQNLVTWRGSKLTDRQFEVFDVGKVYQVPSFIATSVDKRVAQAFASWGSGKIICFEVPKGSHAADISKHSNHQVEEEILLDSYTWLKVINKTENVLYLRVLERFVRAGGTHSFGDVPTMFI